MFHANNPFLRGHGSFLALLFGGSDVFDGTALFAPVVDLVPSVRGLQ